MALAFRAGTAKNISLTDSNESKNLINTVELKIKGTSLLQITLNPQLDNIESDFHTI